jgi:thioredoxin 1
LSRVIEVNSDVWEKEILNCEYLVVVDFWHQRCPWCIKQDPVYAEVAEDYKDEIKFAKLNILETDQNREIAIKHGIMATPTLIFFCGGRVIETVTGFQPKERLIQTIDGVIERHKDCLKGSTPIETS